MQATENCPNTMLTAECTVNAALAKSPAAYRVFREHGIDTCCGGGLRIADAAALARVSVDIVIAEIASALQSPKADDAGAVGAACGCGCGSN